MDDRASFVQEVPRDLQCCPMILAICVVEDVSKNLDILIWEFCCSQETHVILAVHKNVTDQKCQYQF